MECLRDYIGVRGCGTTVPPSSVYLNDLAGISLRSLGSMADTQQQTFTGVYRDIQTRALMRLSDDFRAEIGKRYKLKQVGDSIHIPKSRLGGSATTQTVTATDAVGITIELDYIYAGTTKEFITSPLSAPYVQDVWFYLDAGADGDEVTFIVRDMDTGETLFTTDQVCDEGWNRIPVNRIFNNNYFDKSRKLFIGAQITTDNGTLTPQYMDASDIRINGTCCQFRVRGAVLSDAGAITEGDDCFGLSAVVSIRCSFDSLVCTNKDIFKRSLLYCLGMETMLEQINTDRLSEFSTIRKDKAEQLLEKYTTDYMGALKSVAESIDLECDCCIECGGNGQYYIVETV